MSNSKKVLAGVMGVVLGGATITAQAAMLNNGDVLTISAGVTIYDIDGNPGGVSGGSWFSVDQNGSRKVTVSEKTAIFPGSDGGLRIGSLQSIGAIDIWPDFFGATGYHYMSVAPAGGTTSGIDFSGWAIYWYGAPVPNDGDYGAWTPLNCATLGCTGVSFAADVASFNWSGVYGDSYSLWYSWSFLSGPGAWVPTDYLLHLEGTVLPASAVPVPAAAWLFGSGLLGLLGVARCKVV